MEDVVISSKYLAHYGLIFTIQLQRLPFYIGPIGDLTFFYNKYTFRQVKHYN